MDAHHIILKNIGETPLECIERFRAENAIPANIPMTYAGRLDPLASGKLIVLIGDECKNKEKYTALDKEYEVEVLFGIETDTGDVLGRIVKTSVPDIIQIKNIDLKKYIGIHSQTYPAYSSKTVDGKALHTRAREGTLPEIMPARDVSIYEIEIVGSPKKVLGLTVVSDSLEKIAKVKGDFRQLEICKDWQSFREKYGSTNFIVLKMSMKCSSGTYMRSLAQRIGDDAGCGALAFSIHRTKIGNLN